MDNFFTKYNPKGRKFKLYTSPISEDEKKLFGVFISHSSKDEEKYLNPLVAEMKTKKNQLMPIYSESFLSGGEDFHDKIKSCIHCSAAVVIVTPNSIKSDWVNYECGYLEKLQIPIVIWDPEHILDFEDIDYNLLNVHLTQYLPTYHSLEEVIERLKKLSLYSDMFNQECRKISRQWFRDVLKTRVSSSMVHMSSDLLNSQGELFEGCKLGTLIVNFGMMYPNQGDGTGCCANKMMDIYDGEDDEYLQSNAMHICELTGRRCCLNYTEDADISKEECVVLNHIMYNGKYFDKDEEYYDGKILSKGRLSFFVPVNHMYGTEFKFIVDTQNTEKHIRLFNLFERLGMNPTVSDSFNDLRIYLSLPDIPAEGLFRLNHDFNNNFLCPRAISEDDDRD